MNRMDGEDRSNTVTPGTPNRGRKNPYTNTRMPPENEETRDRQDVEDLEEE